MQPELSKTLDQLENTDWGEPTYSSYLVRTCHALRKKPLQDFTIEDLRIMIGQNISLEYLMPLAIPELEKNILAEGDFYPGDLLKAVLSAEGGFWEKHQGTHERVATLFRQNINIFESNKEFKEINKAFEGFEGIVFPTELLSKKRGKKA
ncbi:contact-dependent growth inhibition system immunity protein [Flavobacterium sp. DGU11]|uniref:Contact-dependent growth inhibition system immunity protein n=1 Tax=Flavobacterium arundinis TaxID=3139143 RepID=A0ABU9I1E4_9FLAO